MIKSKKQKGCLKMIKNFFFDLDGTLLQMDIDRFTKIYFNGIGNLVSKFSFEEFMNYMNAGIKAMYKNESTGSAEYHQH